MKLTVNNLGPITTETTIDFSKNLTIIAGPNSTGKSYITYSLWKMFDFETIMGKIYSHIGTQIIDNGTHKLLGDMVTEYFNNESTINFLPKDTVKDIIKDIVLTYKDFINTYNMNEKAIKDLFKDDSIKDANINILHDINIDITVDKILNKFDTMNNLILITTSNLGVYGISEPGSQETLQQSKNRFISFFINFVFSNLLYSNIKLIELSTSERSSAFLFWRSEADKSDQIRFYNNDENKQSALYTEPVLRNIKFARYLGTFDKKESFITKNHPHIIEELERLMGGILRYADTKGVYFNKFKDGTLELDSTAPALPFHMLSSSIRSLTHIYFYLKCRIPHDSIFIIDEPEAYLHPQAQTKMAHIIAMLTNAGIQVIVTTHSDFLIREISNLTMLNQIEKHDREEFITEYKYNEKAFINRDDINIYYSKGHTFKSVNEEESANKDEDPRYDLGLWVESIDDAIETQTEIFDKLENKIIGME